ncbi:hypothetical protein [Azohydromonas lata]|uniref:Uncharacterized protein n=1 Tax=Azohydromonas lata TaxID=45677 RepID=A0ABU5IN40_9BURK|nr:hypothetical protein [Azohydromonas lata]MDZ5460318.1 hypothetical protein [Azohydromonas lata]
MDQTASKLPAMPRDLRVLHAIVLTQGTLVLFVAAQRFAKLASVGLYRPYPLPHAKPLDFDSQSVEMDAGAHVHAIHLHGYFPTQPQLSLAITADSGRKATFHTACRHHEASSQPELEQLSRNFGKLLTPLLERAAKRRASPVDFRATAISDTNAPKIEGEILSVKGSLICGWAWCPDQQERSFEIEILEAGKVVARGRADKYCESLRRRGIGDGGYLFEIELPQTMLQNGLKHTLTVYMPEAKQFLGSKLGLEPEYSGPERNTA